MPPPSLLGLSWRLSTLSSQILSRSRLSTFACSSVKAHTGRTTCLPPFLPNRASNKISFGHGPGSGKVQKMRLSTSAHSQSQAQPLAEGNNATGASLQNLSTERERDILREYRTFGHEQAKLDPLGRDPNTNPWPPNWSRPKPQTETEARLCENLERIYCGALGAEYMHCSTKEEREWLAQRLESRFEPAQRLSNTERIDLAQLLLKGQMFDRFMAAKFVTVKRYSGEGAEPLLAACHTLYRSAALDGIEYIVQSLPHRGRSNLLTCLLNYPPAMYFRKNKGKSEFPSDANVIGDVFSHFFTSTSLEFPSGAAEKSSASTRRVSVTIMPGPSHLEANVPVALGKARGKMLSMGDAPYNSTPVPDSPSPLASGDTTQRPHAGRRVLCFLMHGDASFAGQGLVWETLSMSNTPQFTVGGSIHMLVNNQIGYTTDILHARSTRYASDLAKAINAPILHVNADSVEEVVQASRIAFEYRQRFGRDIFIDLICFRLHGHNELDDPTFTQPRMYKMIQSRKSIPDQFAQILISEKIVSEEELNAPLTSWNQYLNSQLTSLNTFVPPKTYLLKQWSQIQPASTTRKSSWDTGVPIDLLKYIGVKSVHVPPHFKTHVTLEKGHIRKRLEQLGAGPATDSKGAGKTGAGELIDWSTAEALAVGSLLLQGIPARISGEDVARGTFSQRHCTLFDQTTELPYTPLNHLVPNQPAFLEVANSILSEYATLGFEFGFAYEHPQTLNLWEAQFGDFFTGAQIIMDTYLANSESKWQLHNGIVVLLPHGMDGAGPEHSSSRIERFLELCDSSETKVDPDNVNMYIVHPTTPAQYFHLLRRQILRNFRKPLIVFSPKILLRHPAATSNLAEMAPGASFQPVLDDPLWKKDESSVSRVILCSGKHYYALHQRRAELLDQRTKGKITDAATIASTTAILRIEELCPFPTFEIRNILQRYKSAREYIWAQEEHRNQGAWSFARARVENMLGIKLQYVGRAELGACAVAIGEMHNAEVAQILSAPFAPLTK